MNQQTIFAVLLLGLTIGLTSIALADKKSSTAGDLLPLHSKWEGTEDANESHAGSHDRHCRLTITQRDGDKFQAQYAVGNSGDKLRIEGETADDGTFKAIPVEVIHGAWQRDILKDKWNGKIDGDKIVLERWLSGKGGTKKTELTRKGTDKV